MYLAIDNMYTHKKIYIYVAIDTIYIYTHMETKKN